ncbi:CRM-domain-containing protein [Cinnamomum micranthum f. kanehirae]|uniref:CRM-domain-containing protein n=1 Tax=Cinnamomum micranthum f. kanehirae TaxID=337451 RepID=A0A3S3PUG7_9MAGN|nr:CRM-domain-containing protein [Cinnamomum micranthum f. kanehirae]
MALFPLHLSSSSILSHYPSHSSISLPVFQTRKSSSTAIFNSHRVEIPTSHPTTEPENKQYPERKIASNAIKIKKKKLRPSFHDQTRERWSTKIASQRTKLPWQKQREGSKVEEYEDEQDEDEDEEEEEGAVGVGGEKRDSVSEPPPSILNSTTPLDSAKGQNRWVGKPVSFPFQNLKISAPWAHGSKHRDTLLGSQDKLSASGKTRERRVEKRLEIHVQDKETAVENMIESLNDSLIGGDVDFEEEEDSTANGDDGDFTSSIVKKLKEFGGDAKCSSLNEKRPGFNGIVPSFPDPPRSSSEKQSGNCNDSNGTLMGLLNNGDSTQLPWEREKWRRNNTELAEKTIPEPELRRLRNIALRMKERMTVRAAGITQEVVDKIKEKWKEVEVVKFKFEGPPTLNMKRTHTVLERRTGGLVIWRSGSSLVLYRGMAYKLPCVQSYAKHSQANHDDALNLKESNSDAITEDGSNASSMPAFEDPYNEFTDITDINNLLDELGPRFFDWSGYDPMPVDADLLPGVVPGYKPPFRFLPYGIRPCLHNKEMTTLRRLARTVPPHFALGRNRQHQGLAKAMVKLWEKSAIAKIAIKRGVLNTCNDRMAEEIKNLTGGTLISRNKDYIVFYRGNDFLSPAMKAALLERQKLAKLQQDEEEQARMKASDSLVLEAKTAIGPFVAGTLAETMEARSRWGHQPSSKEIEKMKRDAALAKHASLVRYLEKKLASAEEKVRKAEKALQKVHAFLEPAELPTDLETVTDEERFLFRKIGLSMKPYLLLGRRGVFDGTVENMHLHWKYKELVKILVKGKSFPQVKHVAINLEAESGGVLISLDKTSKGYAIIVYRGKNYQRPQTMRPKNLLTKRQALARSIELQRREALKHHISDLRERIEMLKSELEQMEVSRDTDDGDLYSQLANAYASDDDLVEEGEEAYLKTYDSGDESDNSASEESASEIECSN